MAKKNGKFKYGFVAAARQELETEAEQQRLHEKYDVDPEKIIVEKNNMFKFTVKTFGQLVHIIATVMVLILAALGLLALLYPEVRIELMKVLLAIMEQIKHMVGF